MTALRITGHLVGTSRRNGLAGNGGYVYQGTKRATPEELAAEAARSQRSRRNSLRKQHPAGPAEHGTLRGARTLHKGGQAREPCREAKREDGRRYRASLRGEAA